MKITRLTAYPLVAPLARPRRTGVATFTANYSTLIRIETDAGIEGWGECLARYAPKVWAELAEEVFQPVVDRTKSFSYRVSLGYNVSQSGIFQRAFARDCPGGYCRNRYCALGYHGKRDRQTDSSIARELWSRMAGLLWFFYWSKSHQRKNCRNQEGSGRWIQIVKGQRSGPAFRKILRR